ALLRLKFMRSNEQDVETLILLADKYFIEKNYSEALKIQEKALELAGKNYGTDSLKVARVHRVIATTFLAQDNFAAAEDHYVKDLVIRKAHFGPDSSELAMTLRLLAICRGHQGDNESNEKLWTSAKDIEEKSGIEDIGIHSMLVGLEQE